MENDGTTGLEKALREDCDLIVLDLMLPGIDGFEICRKIREEKNIPILIVSARKEDIDNRHITLRIPEICAEFPFWRRCSASS